MNPNCSYSAETSNLGQNWPFFVPCDLEIWWNTLKNHRSSVLCYFKLCAAFCSHWWIQTGVIVWQRLIWVKIDDFFRPCDLKIWRMPFKNNRAPLLCYFKLCAAFRSHWWIQTGVTVRKSPIWVKINEFLAVGPWSWTDDLQKQLGNSHKHYQDICIISPSYVNSNLSYSPETPKLGQIRRFLEQRDLEIWQMTFKKIRAPLQCYFKLCAAFRSHWWIPTEVTVRKRPIWVKFDDF